MDLGAADTYLVFTVRSRRFAVPLAMVAGVSTLSQSDAEQLREHRVIDWQGFYCPAFEAAGLGHRAAGGDTAIIIETGAGRRVIACEPKTTSRTLLRRWPVPRPLLRLHPAVAEAAWEGGELVHCLDVERAAA